MAEIAHIDYVVPEVVAEIALRHLVYIAAVVTWPHVFAASECAGCSPDISQSDVVPRALAIR